MIMSKESKSVNISNYQKFLEFPGGLVVKDLVLSPLWLRFDP